MSRTLAENLPLLAVGACAAVGFVPIVRFLHKQEFWGPKYNPLHRLALGFALAIPVAAALRPVCTTFNVDFAYGTAQLFAGAILADGVLITAFPSAYGFEGKEVSTVSNWAGTLLFSVGASLAAIPLLA